METERKTILIIDDDPDIVQLLAYNLQQEGYRVFTASSGLAGLWDLVGSDKPDLILLDIMMPSPNGYELCRFLKTSEEFHDVPVVIISAKGSPEEIRKGIEVGADGYIPKPFRIEALLQILDGHLKADARGLWPMKKDKSDIERLCRLIWRS